MTSSKYCGGLSSQKASPKSIVPQAMLLPVVFSFALILSLGTGCSVKQDSSYSPSAALSSPSGVRVTVSSANQAQHSDVVSAAKSSIGTPYRFGGSSPETGFDCSGLVCWTYEQVGVRVPRRAQDQLGAGSRVLKRSELRPGDIVVFKGTNNRTGWHSGIYTGNGNFVHSPRSGKNVTESSLDEEYFSRRFAGGSRVAGDSGGLMAAAYTPASKTLSRQSPAKNGSREEVTLAEAADMVPENDAPPVNAAPSSSSRKESPQKVVPPGSVKSASVKQAEGKTGKAKGTAQSKTLASAKDAKNKTVDAPAKAKSTDKSKTVASAKGKTPEQSKPTSGAKSKSAPKGKAISVSMDKAAKQGKAAPAKAAVRKTAADKGKSTTPSRTVASSGQKNSASKNTSKKQDKPTAKKVSTKKNADKKRAS